LRFLDYKSYFDSNLLLASGFIIIFVFFIAILIFFTLRKRYQKLSLAIPIILTISQIFPLFFIVNGYGLNGYEIIVKRFLNSNVYIKRNAISEIRIINNDELSGITRTLGVYGQWGYYGRFDSKKLGKMTWYVTNLKNLIFIKLKNGEGVLISPGDQNKFFNDYNSR